MSRAAIISYRIEPIGPPVEGAVEVVVKLADGQERWCFFSTPERMSLVGDWVEGTRVRVHVGVSHAIVVTELTHDVIDRVLKDLERQGLLLEHTRSLDSPQIGENPHGTSD